VHLSVLEELDLSNNKLTYVDLQLFDPAIASKLSCFNGRENCFRQPPQELVSKCWVQFDKQKQLEGVQRLQLYVSQKKMSHSQMKLAVVGKEQVDTQRKLCLHKIYRRGPG
jgi:hypothetical protein